MSQFTFLMALTCIIFELLIVGVTADTKIWGSVEHSDVYLRREAINMPAIRGMAKFEFVFPKKNEVNQFIISSIRAFDNDLENLCSVTLVKGGLGTTEAKLLITSGPERGINFVIEIYGKPL